VYTQLRSLENADSNLMERAFNYRSMEIQEEEEEKNKIAKLLKQNLSSLQDAKYKPKRKIKLKSKIKATRIYWKIARF
jgi:hypothetical protein